MFPLENPPNTSPLGVIIIALPVTLLGSFAVMDSRSLSVFQSFIIRDSSIDATYGLEMLI